MPMLPVQGPRFREHCMGFTYIQILKIPNGEIEELWTKMDSSDSVKEPADGQKVGVTAIPIGFRTNFTQFSYEQMSVLLQPCYMDHWATTSRGRRPLQGQSFLS